MARCTNTPSCRAAASRTNSTPIPSGSTCTAARVAPQAPHTQGTLRCLRRRSARATPIRRRTGDGDERLRHQLRCRQRSLCRQQRGTSLHVRADSRGEGPPDAHLSRQPHRNSISSTACISTACSSTSSVPARLQPQTNAPTRSCCARGSAQSSRHGSGIQAGSCSTHIRASSPSSGGWAPSNHGSAHDLRTDAGRTPLARGGGPIAAARWPRYRHRHNLARRLAPACR